MWKRLPLETQQEIWRLDCQGRSVTEIARMIKRSRHGVANVLARAAAQRAVPKVWAPSPGHLSIAEREEIRAGLERDESFTMIALAHRSSGLDRLARGRRRTWTQGGLSGRGGPACRESRAPAAIVTNSAIRMTS